VNEFWHSTGLQVVPGLELARAAAASGDLGIFGDANAHVLFDVLPLPRGHHWPEDPSGTLYLPAGSAVRHPGLVMGNGHPIR
jgi:hypothetical protein